MTDAELANTGKEICIKNMDMLSGRILASNPDIVGFSVWNSNHKASLETAAAIKKTKPGTVVVFGGQECFPMIKGDDFAMAEGVDVVVYGEGELPFLSVVRAVANRLPFTGCPGVILKKGDHGIIINKNECVKNIEELPIPDFRKFDLPLYTDTDGKSLFILSNRGCPNSCVYCNVSANTRYRWRSGEAIFNEMKTQMQRHPEVETFQFASTALNSNVKELTVLCDLLIRADIGIKWNGNALLTSTMDDALIEKMSLAGCNGLVFGLESASQRIVDLMGKSFDIKDCSRILKACHANKINIVLNFIIGFPGETDTDFAQTCEFLKENAAYIKSVGSRSVCYVTPYSQLFDEPGKYGIDISPYKKFAELPENYYGVIEEYMTKSACIRDWRDLGTPENSYDKRNKKQKAFEELVKSLRFGIIIP